MSAGDEDLWMWARDARFNHFWSHHTAVAQWRAEHRERIVRAINFVNSMSTVSSSAVSPVAIAAKRQRFGAKISRSPRGSPRFRTKAVGRDADADTEAAEEAEDEDEIEEEMSPEYAAFVKQTQEHQRARDAVRVAQRQKEEEAKKRHWIVINDVEYMPADKIGDEGAVEFRQTLEAPDEGKRVAQKKARAVAMYGEQNAQRLLAMETAVQLRFDTRRRQRRPPLWPVIPFRF